MLICIRRLEWVASAVEGRRSVQRTKTNGTMTAHCTSVLHNVMSLALGQGHVGKFFFFESTWKGLSKETFESLHTRKFYVKVMLSTVADDSHCLFTDKSLWTNQSSAFAKVLAQNRDGPIFRNQRRRVTLESLLSKVFFLVTFERKLSSVTWALDFLWKDAGSKFWLLHASSRTACLYAWHSFILLLDRFLPRAEDVPVPPFISHV